MQELPSYVFRPDLWSVLVRGLALEPQKSTN